MSEALPSTAHIKTIGLGVTVKHDEVLLFVQDNTVDTFHWSTLLSKDGLDFQTTKQIGEIKDNQRRELPIDKCSDFRISRIEGKYHLSYKFRQRFQHAMYSAFSSDLVHWKRNGKISELQETTMLVPDFRLNSQYVVLYGEQNIKMATSKDLTTWVTETENVLEPGIDHAGSAKYKLGTIVTTPEGLAVIYLALSEHQGQEHYSLHAVLLDRKNPRKLLWQSDTLWEQTDEWIGQHVIPFGIVYFRGKLISYWNHPTQGVLAIPHTSLTRAFDTKPTIPAMILKRFRGNPIIKPIVHHFWESRATFNPAAVHLNGKIHLVYRAIGDDDTSVLGYATSSDGFTIDERLDEPIYYPRAPFESPNNQAPYIPNRLYMSGGGYGGCEDPRLTKIDDTMYLTYIAYDGRNPPRVALSSLPVDKFLAREWTWNEPVLISGPGVVNKNCVILPEKVDGKYVILHRIFPNILIDFVESMDFDGETNFLKGDYMIRPSRNGWDSRKVGAGPPPIKTPYGWLLIYHAVGERDPGKYKMGAMLLDLNDPTKVIARSRVPILAPEHEHENDGFKAGVAYPCGAVIHNDNLFVYYGGADTVVCTATAPIQPFLHTLLETGNARVTPVHTQMYGYR